MDNEMGDALSDSTTTPLITLSHLSKRFGATQALDDVSFSINSGEVIALLGANGAGKSTIIKILAKIYTADKGEIKPTEGRPLEDVKFAFIHQDLGLVDWMTVAESIALGSTYPKKLGVIDWRGVRTRAHEALQRVAPHINPKDTIKNLSRADRSLVVIARALYGKTDVLVLDEPTASLHASDCENLFQVLRNLRNEGCAIIYVSHRLDEIFKVSDRVVVLRDGKMVEDGQINDFSPDSLVRAIVGGENKRFALGEFSHGAPVLEVEELSGPNILPTSFKVHKGEVLGLVGLNGAGQREIGRIIAGDLDKYAGHVTLNGKELRGDVERTVDNGVSLITSSRLEEGLFADITVRENMFPNLHVRGFGAFRFMNFRREREKTFHFDEEFNIKPRTTELSIATLSGGNQQKVILARWLSMDRDLIVLEEPTAGVDVGAKSEIYQLIKRATDSGLSILLVSTDFEEVSLMAHRALVFSSGEIVRELPRSEISIENLVTYASRANVSA
jgi:ribose transport system ATP-binding protein